MRRFGWMLVLLTLLLPALGNTAEAMASSATAAVSDARQKELKRLETDIERLRERLRQDGRVESERGRPDWWDLPSRRRQGERLRYLRNLHRDLERRIQALEVLRQDLLKDEKH